MNEMDIIDNATGQPVSDAAGNNDQEKVEPKAEGGSASAGESGEGGKENPENAGGAKDEKPAENAEKPEEKPGDPAWLAKRLERQEKKIRREYEERIAALEKSTAKKEESEEPKREDYDNPKKFAEDFLEYHKKKAREEAKAEAKSEREKAESEASVRKLVEKIGKAEAKLRNDHSDYEAVVSSVPDALRSELIGVLEEDACAVAYRLGKDQDLIEDLMEMPKAKRLIKIGALLGAPAGENKNQQPPPPIKPVAGTSGKKKGIGDPDIPLSEFKKQWNNRK